MYMGKTTNNRMDTMVSKKEKNESIKEELKE